jgi:SagB-type dehydrogenase family enzyme
MSKGRSGRHFGFLSNRLDDPRRIQLRQGAFLEAYRRRDTSADLIEIGHELTKLQRADAAHIRDAVALFQQPDMHSIQFTHDRDYPLQPRTRLPEPTALGRLFLEVVRGRRSCRMFAGNCLSFPDLSTLLFAALGETGQLIASIEDDGPVVASLRSIASGGALHPTHIFVAALQDGDFSPGLYHFDAPDHAIEHVKPLSPADIAALFDAFPIHPEVVDLAAAAAIFFITTKFWRPRAKYGPRGYRYCLQEAGAACQNLSLAAASLDLAHVVLGGFFDDEVHSWLGIDGIDHAVITTVAVGAPAPGATAEPSHAGF